MAKNVLYKILIVLSAATMLLAACAPPQPGDPDYQQIYQTGYNAGILAAPQPDPAKIYTLADLDARYQQGVVDGKASMPVPDPTLIYTKADMDAAVAKAKADALASISAQPEVVDLESLMVSDLKALATFVKLHFDALRKGFWDIGYVCVVNNPKAPPQHDGGEGCPPSGCPEPPNY